MRSIGASTAIQKGNGSGDTEDAVPGTDFALPAAEAAVTLAAASWSGAAAPFTQTVAVPGITADQKAVVGLAHSASSAQYLAAAEAMLHATAQGAGSITITAEGKAPAIDLPILVQIVG